jgi:predicted phosphodiesterase
MTMTRIGLIADIHGNDVALRAVLEDIADVGVDDLLCLGDVATLGPEPVASLRRLREAGARCVKGNHDAFLVEPHRVHEYTKDPGILAAVAWCRDQLSADDVEYLRTFPQTLEQPLADGVSVLAFHGSPRSYLDELLPTTPAADVDRLLDGAASLVLASGHTHIQMLRQFRSRLIVNPGSVGMPFLESFSGGAPKLLAHAEWAVVEATPRGVHVGLRRVGLERSALCASVHASGQPLRGWLLQEWAER